MSAVGAHPERLLLALDEALDHEIQLIVYGRGAIWLGFENPPAESATTQDVDAIIPNEQVQALADDVSFWDARDAEAVIASADQLNKFIHDFLRRSGDCIFLRL